MSEHGSSSTGADSEIDDPGRDPAILDTPRNIFGGADQDTGRGEPEGTPGLSGPSDVPASPDEADGRA